MDAVNGAYTNSVLSEDDEDRKIAGIPPPTDSAVVDLELALTVSSPLVQGDTSQVTVTLSNAGDTTAYGVAVQHPLLFGVQDTLSIIPSQGSYDAGAGMWTLGDLGPGQQASLQLFFVTPDTATRTAFAQVWAATPGDVDSEPASISVPTNGDYSGVTIAEDDEDKKSTGGSTPGYYPPCERIFTPVDLEIAVAVLDTGKVQGGVVPTRIVVYNRSANDATGVTATILWDHTIMSQGPGTTHTGPHELNGQDGSWLVGNLAAGDSAVYNLNLSINAPPHTSALFAEVRCHDQVDADSNPGSINPPAFTGNYLNINPVEDDEATAVIVPGGGSNGGGNPVDLELELFVTSGPVSEGNYIQTRLIIRNTSSYDADSVRVYYPLLSSIFSTAYAYVDSIKGDYNTIDGYWTIFELPAGSVDTFKFDWYINVTQTNPVYLFAQIAVCIPGDSDSTPGSINAPSNLDFSGITPVEADELLFVLQPSGTNLIQHPHPPAGLQPEKAEPPRTGGGRE